MVIQMGQYQDLNLMQFKNYKKKKEKMIYASSSNIIKQSI